MTCRTPAVHLNRDYLLFEETCSAPALNLGSGALYGSINKMLEQGLIEESEERPDPHLDDERRRSFTASRRSASAWHRPRPCE
jgi:hypothetical protein